MNNDYITFAHQLADSAGDIVRRYYRQPVGIETKADDSPVTQADKETEATLRALITETFPDHGIIGEEAPPHLPHAQNNTILSEDSLSQRNAKSEEHKNASVHESTCGFKHRSDAAVHSESRIYGEYCWVIDPIDGTRAFMAGMPTFTTLIALLHKGAPIYSIIDQPITQDRWEGDGRSAQLNGTAITTRPCPDLPRAMLSTTSPHFFSEEEFVAFSRLQTTTNDCIYGKDGLAYAQLASGQIDLVCEAGLKPYDVMALIPIIEGAGGMITDWQGNALTPHNTTTTALAAGDKALHKAALAVLEGR